jgi:hypothetical protein
MGLFSQEDYQSGGAASAFRFGVGPPVYIVTEDFAVRSSGNRPAIELPLKMLFSDAKVLPLRFLCVLRSFALKNALPVIGDRSTDRSVCECRAALAELPGSI